MTGKPNALTNSKKPFPLFIVEARTEITKKKKKKKKMANLGGGGGGEEGGFASEMRRSIQSLAATRQPWPVFLDPTALSLPSPLSETTTRIAQNLTHFRYNYAVVLTAAILFSLLLRPLSLLALLLVGVAWVFLFFARDDDQPQLLAGREVPDGFIVILLAGLTVGVLVWASAWGSLVMGASAGAVLVVLHAVLRSTDDLVEDYERNSATYADLLSEDDYGQLRDRV